MSTATARPRPARSLRPDVVLLDIRMPRMDGVEATARLTALQQPPRVLVLTTFDLDEYLFGALRAGAAGFLLKDAPRERLVEAIHVVHAGEALLSPSITRRLIADYAARSRSVNPPGRSRGRRATRCGAAATTASTASGHSRPSRASRSSSASAPGASRAGRCGRRSRIA